VSPALRGSLGALAAVLMAGCATAPAGSDRSASQSAASAPALTAEEVADRNAFFVQHARNGECDAVVQAIDQGTPIDAVDSLDQTALVAAISQGHEDCATQLLERHASVSTRDPAGWTPLLFAVFFNASPALIDALLKHGADINAQNDRGVTALHLAAGAGNELLVALLLGQGANRDLATVSGYTPLRLAQTKGLKNIVALLDKPLPVATPKSAAGSASATRASAP
jgi:ankyrin repeat protein